MDDLLRAMCNLYNGFTTVSSLKQVANCSLLCQESRCLNKVNVTSQYRFFKFGSKAGTGKQKEGTVHCLVRGTVENPWKDLSMSGATFFLKFIRDITKKPP